MKDLDTASPVRMERSCMLSPSTVSHSFSWIPLYHSVFDLDRFRTASYLDVYDVTIASPYLSHSQRLSVIPRTLDETRLQYRGDTLRLSLDGTRLYVTTRGKTPHEKGYVSVWKVAQDGGIEEMRTGEESGYGALHRYETKTSGGKANAIEVFPFRSTPGRDWIVLTDDEEGWVTILEWRDEWMELREIACAQLGRQEGAEKDEEVTGASHAVWLS